jgi:antitoxin (DNA-binding transcriptional repressor) of toxin-antitoxin stability system
MSTYNLEMDISVSEFKQRCLDMIRQVERTGAPIAITRRGRVVAQLRRPAVPQAARVKPWEQLRAAGGRLLAAAGESVLAEEDFEATR